ncbi:hypothetical protein BaRGS_00033923, partial [Batillaria attramentaria]
CIFFHLWNWFTTDQVCAAVHYKGDHRHPSYQHSEAYCIFFHLWNWFTTDQVCAAVHYKGDHRHPSYQHSEA